ncbi:dicer 1 protein [Rutstroemia sp. NJR-2017a BVV2]|nr:dicer 1 protein [Rutstroemia sp. NJR-2017a BVV2]
METNSIQQAEPLLYPFGIEGGPSALCPDSTTAVYSHATSCQRECTITPASSDGIPVYPKRRSDIPSYEDDNFGSIDLITFDDSGSVDLIAFDESITSTLGQSSTDWKNENRGNSNSLNPSTGFLEVSPQKDGLYIDSQELTTDRPTVVQSPVQRGPQSLSLDLISFTSSGTANSTLEDKSIAGVDLPLVNITHSAINYSSGNPPPLLTTESTSIHETSIGDKNSCVVQSTFESPASTLRSEDRIAWAVPANMAIDENPAPLLPYGGSTNLPSFRQPMSSIMMSESSRKTALALRTADDVFEDLRRPLHLQPGQIDFEDEKVDHAAINGVGKSSTVDRKEHDREVGLFLEDNEDEEEEPSDQPVPEVKMLSARKQKHNAIFDSFLLAASKQTKAEKHSSVEDDAQQSTRWLIDQSEKQQIISSPRDYQIELFERAKDRNIIAVLDTGSSSVISVVFS